MPASVLITGATGPLGRAVVQNLLARTSADRVAALVRDAGKAADLAVEDVDVRVGDYSDPASLDRAVAGIDTVLLVSGNEGDRLTQHRNVIEAARKAGVRRIGYTSRNLSDPDALVNGLMKEHFETEADVRASGMTYAIFRNALYLDTLPQFIGGAQAFDAGIRLPAGDGRTAYALRREQGEGIAAALLDDGAEDRVYTLTGSEAVSYDDVAEALSELAGKDVTYTPVDAQSFLTTLKARGLPDVVAERVLGFALDIKNGQESGVSRDLEELLGRKPASLKAGLKELFDL